MKNPKLILGILAAIAIAAILILPRRPAEPLAELKPVALAALPDAPVAAPNVERTQLLPQPVPKTSVVDLPEAASAPIDQQPLRAEQVLATVNSKPIRLSDLLPIAPEDTEQKMTDEQYESRLNRAIEVELTFRAAQAQAVELTPEQQRRLNKIAQAHQATFSEYKQQGISWSSVTAAQLEFEKRLASALMLQQNLVAKEAAVAPSPDPVIQTRFEQALGGMLARLKTSANIRIADPGL